MICPRTLAIVAVLAAALPAQADTSQAWAAGVIERCIDTHGLESCISVASQSCMSTEGPGAEGLCLGAERAGWEARAQASMAALDARERAAAGRGAQRGFAQTPSLQAAWEAFEAYRDAACAFETADWEGMHTGPVDEACRLRITAHHALWLEGLRAR